MACSALDSWEPSEDQADDDRRLNSDNSTCRTYQCKYLKGECLIRNLEEGGEYFFLLATPATPNSFVCFSELAKPLFHAAPSPIVIPFSPASIKVSSSPIAQAPRLLAGSAGVSPRPLSLQRHVTPGNFDTAELYDVNLESFHHGHPSGEVAQASPEPTSEADMDLGIACVPPASPIARYSSPAVATASAAAVNFSKCFSPFFNRPVLTSGSHAQPLVLDF